MARAHARLSWRREVSEHARRRRGVKEQARSEEMRSGVDVSCDETSDILAHIDFVDSSAVSTITPRPAIRRFRVKNHSRRMSRHERQLSMAVERTYTALVRSPRAEDVALDGTEAIKSAVECRQ